MNYDLFISDFDWTLGHEPDVIEENTVKAIKEYQKKGGIFSVCSGRVFFSVRNILKKYGISCPVCSNQGAEITEMNGEKLLYKSGIETELAKEIYSDLIKEGVKVVVYVNNDMYYKYDTDYTERHRKEGALICHKVIDPSVAFYDKTVSRIAGFNEGLNVDYIIKKYSKKYEGKVIFNSGSKNLLEIVNPNCSKGQAVKFLSQYYKIPYNRIITVGDSTNDIELVNGEWFGVATGDGANELKKVAKEITVPFSQNPVEYLLRKYCL